MERKDLRTFLCLVFITLSTNAYSGEVEDIIRNEAVKLNQNVPVMLDTYLRLDIVSAYKRTLVYNATILDDPSDRKSASEIENEQRKHICSMGSGDLALQRNFKWLKENNVVYKYNYFDTDKKLITTFRIEIGKCNSNDNIKSLVLRVQKELTSLGYNLGQIDGKLGPKTTKAIKQFQRESGLHPDGLVTEELLLNIITAHTVGRRESIKSAYANVNNLSLAVFQFNGEDLLFAVCTGETETNYTGCSLALQTNKVRCDNNRLRFEIPQYVISASKCEYNQALAIRSTYLFIEPEFGIIFNTLRNYKLITFNHSGHSITFRGEWRKDINSVERLIN